jgi:nucleotide-binding universal stress UspA family protein
VTIVSGHFHFDGFFRSGIAFAQGLPERWEMTSIKNILVPTDFSDTSDEAIRDAVDFARSFGARIYLLHVPGTVGEHFEADFPLQEFETTVRTRLSPFFTVAEIASLHLEYVLRVGTPAAEIVRYAENREIDLIVMGTHGRTGLPHLLMGSVAEQVVRLAPCKVMLVKQPKRVAAVSGRTDTSIEASAPVMIL